MAGYRDKRSGNGKGGEENEFKAPHRIAPGVRNTSQFFGAGNLDRPMTRGDFLRVHAMNEYHRQETRWYRRLFRFVRGLPQVPDMCAHAAAAHARQLDAIAERLQERMAAPDPTGKMAAGFPTTPPDDRG